MDPLSLIVTALASGAAAALKPTAENVIKDAYSGLKTIIRNRYQRAAASIESLEDRPDSGARKSVVEEDLRDEKAAEDEELLRMAQHVLQAVEQHDPAAADAAGVDLKDIRVGASVNIKKIVASGTGVRIEKADIEEDLNIEDVKSGIRGESPGS